jgi:hydrogenase expression/formation protein HypD
MRYIEEFRDGRLAKGLAAAIAAEVTPGRSYRLMEFCGGHTHAIFRYGVQDLLPPEVHMVHGPGCPVCVLPVGRLDMAIGLARRQGVILCSYGDMLRVPASRRSSLSAARAEGADVRMVYSASDALEVARRNPDREVVFFAIGFETTTPPTAVAIRTAAAESLKNFSVFANQVLTPAAIAAILDTPDDAEVDGFLGPAHVSVVIGSRPYERFAQAYRKPVVITGFEPLDVMQAVLMLVRQLDQGRAEVENQYIRAVSRDGNARAQAMMAEIFETRASFEWRGLGSIPASAIQIREAYAAFDAERKFDLAYVRARENRECLCPSILRGASRPPDCRLFGTVCTPEKPIGSCKVSAEGACAAYWSYARHEAGHAA